MSSVPSSSGQNFDVRGAVRTWFGTAQSTLPSLRSPLLDLLERTPRRGVRPPPQRCMAVRDPMSPEAIRNLMRQLPARPAVVGKTDIAGGVRRYGQMARIASQHVERLHPRMRGLLHGIDPANLALAVAFKESTNDPNEESGAGAVGLMQVMPATALPLLRSRLLFPDLNASDFASLERDPDAALRRPEISLRVGLAVLAERIEARRGNLTLALADYNAGLVAVNRAGGVPNNPETRDYVRRVPAYQLQVAEAARRIIG